MNSPVLIALDFPDRASVLALVSRLSPELCRLKVGKELFTRCGPGLVETLQSMGFEIFLDLKYHDIPNTVAAAVRAAAELGVWMVNVHAGGGRLGGFLLTQTILAMGESTITPEESSAAMEQLARAVAARL